MRSRAAKLAALALGLPVHLYIVRHRERLRTRGRILTHGEKVALEGYFTTEILNGVRIVCADPLPVADPPFTSIARSLGFQFPGLALTAAITFDDVIACRNDMDISLLFHELVHVVQYRSLGVAGFARGYVHGFLTSGAYLEIPLERCAYELQFRYEGETERFSVESEVVRNLERGNR